jgi:hypothetical protein
MSNNLPERVSVPNITRCKYFLELIFFEFKIFILPEAPKLTKPNEGFYKDLKPPGIQYGFVLLFLRYIHDRQWMKSNSK